MVEPPQAPAITSKRVPRAPPTVDELRRRVAGLETALQKVTAPGEDPDPSALTLLRKYKVEATMLNTPVDRQQLADNLRAFERTFLQR